MMQSLDICKITGISAGNVWLGLTSNKIDVHLLKKPAQQNLFCFLGRTLEESPVS